MTRAEIVSAYRAAKADQAAAWTDYQDAYRPAGERTTATVRLYFWLKARYAEAKARRQYFEELILDEAGG